MKESNIQYAHYLLKGILFGIGFIAALILGAHYIAHLLERPLTVVVKNPPGIVYSHQTYDLGFKKELTIVSYIAYKEKGRASNYKILGNIKNMGNDPWTNIEIQAEFFNKGEFVDECVGHIRILQPQENDNFEILCGECGMDTVTEHDQTRLKIAAAFKPH